MAFSTFVAGTIANAGSVNENFLTSRNFYNITPETNLGVAGSYAGYITHGSVCFNSIGSTIGQAIAGVGSVWGLYSQQYRLIISGTTTNYQFFTATTGGSQAATATAFGPINFSGLTPFDNGSMTILWQVNEPTALQEFGISGLSIKFLGMCIASFS